MTRTATATRDLTHRELTVRAATADESSRTVEALIASEAPVAVLDFRSGRIIDEILLAAGADWPEQAPLLDSHRRESVDRILGSVRGFHIERDGVAATLHLSEGDGRADSVWRSIAAGHIDSVSVGYALLDFSTINAGRTGTVSGRKFTAPPDRDLRVVTGWRIREVSLVAIGADANAKTRGDEAAYAHRGTKNMPNIITVSRSTGTWSNAHSPPR